MGAVEAAQTLPCPSPAVYVPRKPTAARVRPFPAAGALVVLSDVSQALNLGSLQRRCSSTVDTAVRRVSALLFQLHGPWASAVVAAPPLTVDHPPDSALEVCWSTEAHWAGRNQVDNWGRRGAQVGGGWGSNWNSKAYQLGIRVSRDRVEEAMEGDHRSAPVGALPRAHGGKGRCMRRALPFACHSLMALCFYGVQASPMSTSGCGAPHSRLLMVNSSPLPWAALQTPHSSTQPLPSPPIPPNLRWWTPILGWGTQGCCRDHLCRPHSVLLHSSLHSLLHFPHTQISPSVPSNIPACEGASPDAGTSSHLELPAECTGLIQLPLFFLLF